MRAITIEPRHKVDGMGIKRYFIGETDDVAPLRICHEDGTHHFSDVKRLNDSGRSYLYYCNAPIEPTRAMLIGTAVHFFTLGERQGAKPIVLFEGGARRGKGWESFRDANKGAEILTVTEWSEAQAIAAALKEHPLAIERFEGARFEVPLTWEEDGLLCSTSGIDIVLAAMIGDLKVTSATEPTAWTRQAWRMLYPQQLAWYRRAALANGLDVSQGLFLLGVEASPPYDVVPLDLTEGMIDYADRSVCGWLEKLRVLRDSYPRPMSVADWPGYTQSPMPFDLPKFMQELEEEAGADGESAELEAAQ